MKLPVAVFAAVFIVIQSSLGLDLGKHVSLAKLEAAAQAAEQKLLKTFHAAALLRDRGNIIDPDPESAAVIVSVKGNDKENAQAYIEAKAKYLNAKALHERAKKNVEEAKKGGKAGPGKQP
jgi:hypothetical protein